MHEYIFEGLQPAPLGSYLKALGVFRLVAAQLDAHAAAHWSKGGFVLRSTASRDDVAAFLLSDYYPSPIANPWNGAGGFYYREDKSSGKREAETAATRALASIRDSSAERLVTLRDAVTVARGVVDDMGLDAAPKGGDKFDLVRRLRDRLSDQGVAWIDAALVVGSEDLGFPPVLGTGGTEGALDFASNYYQRLAELFDFATGEPTAGSANLLRAALHAEPVRGLTKAAIGQFDPSSAGGGNAAPGFDGVSVVNPWDFVLLLEGTFLLASAATRKLATAAPGALVYPFSVRAVGAGYASASAADESDTRNEIWLPLWHAPARYSEIARLFGEGRAEVGRRQAVHAVDFARAIGSLGVDRGIGAFERFGFHKRNGKSYFATPLGRWRVTRNPNLDMIDAPLSRWIDSLRRAARGTHAPASWQRVTKAVETALLDLAGASSEQARKVRTFLCALATAEATIGRTPDGRTKIRPAPALSVHWLARAADRSVEHELAMSLASTNIRERLTTARWVGKVGKFAKWAENDDHRTVWGSTPLDRGLVAVVCRQLVEAQQAGEAPPELPGKEPSIAALAEFLAMETDDEKLEKLIRAYALVPPRIVPGPSRADVEATELPASWGLCVLVHQRVDPVDLDGRQLASSPGLVHRLAGGRGADATRIAARRIGTTGARLRMQETAMTDMFARRMACALAFPFGDALRRHAIHVTTWQTGTPAERVDAKHAPTTR